jgi:geranylgeranyl pyrophosphate synthase
MTALLSSEIRSPALAPRTRPVAAPDATALALARVEQRMQALCGTDEIVGQISTEQLAAGGKRIRARLALAAAAAYDVDEDAAVALAAAVELLHNATLVHDDVQDGDVTRRGVPTAWARHGVPQAINAGDLMLMLPTVALGELDDDVVSPRAQRDLMRALHTRAVATVRGQGADLRLRAVVDEAADVVAAYMQCIEGKTGELFALPVEGACLLAGATPAEARRRAQPFFHLGVLFQLQDDVLDLYGDKGREAPGSDVGEGKVSALVVEHLRLRPSDRAWLLSVLDRPREETTRADVDAAIDAFVKSGAKAAVLARIATLCTLAHHEADAELAPLVLELIGRVLRPIQHCFVDDGSDDNAAVVQLVLGGPRG